MYDPQGIPGLLLQFTPLDNPQLHIYGAEQDDLRIIVKLSYPNGNPRHLFTPVTVSSGPEGSLRTFGHRDRCQRLEDEQRRVFGARGHCRRHSTEHETALRERHGTEGRWSLRSANTRRKKKKRSEAENWREVRAREGRPPEIREAGSQEPLRQLEDTEADNSFTLDVA